MEVQEMDIEVLKKKISTYKSSSGRVGKLSDDLLYEVLTAWENWSGSRLSFYSAIGVSQKGFASILGKAKKLKREGHFPADEFKEVQIDGVVSAPTSSPNGSIVLRYDKKSVIKFPCVDPLIEFLKKAQ
jgi:hypothetical protein